MKKLQVDFDCGLRIADCGIANPKPEFRIPNSAIGNRGFTLIEIIILIVMAGILLPTS